MAKNRLGRMGVQVRMKVINIGSRIVNNYIYETGNGHVLVDTGYETGYENFLKALGKVRIAPQRISHLFLTHAHDDHAGFLNRLLIESPQIKVILSPKALPALRRGQNSFEGGCTSRHALAFCNFMKLLGRGMHRFPMLESRLEQNLFFVTDETRQSLGRLLGGTIYDTPGHTADSLSLLLDDGSLFCGDAAMNGFPSRRKVTIWAENRADYIATWDRIISLKPRVIYPGHGAAFSYGELERNMPQVQKIKLYPLKPS